MIRYNNGDIRTAKSGFIIQGCNAMNSHGSGLAKSISEKWPQVKQKYHEFYDRKGYLNLGEFDVIPVEDRVSVVNLISQDNYGYDGSLYVSYAAIEVGLENIIKYIERESLEKTIHLPKIGCGLAGGDWTVVENIIRKVFLGNFNVNIWVFD